MLRGTLRCLCGRRLGEYAEGTFTILGPGRIVVAVALHVVVIHCLECGLVNLGSDLVRRLSQHAAPRIVPLPAPPLRPGA